MSTTYNTASVQAAMQALQGGYGDAAGRANVYLMNLQTQPEAWRICMELLTAQEYYSSRDELRFLAANMLAGKIRTDWHQLDGDLRGQLSEALLRLICSVAQSDSGGNKPSGEKLVMGRLALALARVAIRAPNGVDLYVQEAFKLAQAHPVHGAPSGSWPTVVMLEMLQLLPEEIESADVNRARRLELLEQVRKHTGSVMQALEHILNNQQASEVVTLALGCFTAWVRLGLSLSELASSHAGLFGLLLRLMAGQGPGPAASGGSGGGGLATLGGLPVVCKACEALGEVLAVEEYPRPASRKAAAQAVLASLLLLPGVFMTCVHLGDGNSAATICSAVVGFAHKEMSLVACGHERGLALVEFLLSCTACPIKRVAILTLDFWLELQDIPVADRHPSLSHPIYIRLLDVLLAQCEYPQGFTSWEDHTDHEEEDHFVDFRDGAQGVRDVLVVVYYMLRARYLSHALDRHKYRHSGWQSLEVTLLALTAVVKEVKGWLDSRSKSPESEQDAAQTSHLLAGLCQSLLGDTALSENPLLLAAGCKLVGAFAFLLVHKSRTAPEHNPLLVPVLQYLTAGLRHHTSRQTAALALRSACSSCERWLVASPPALDALVGVLAVATAAGACVEERLVVTEAVVRVLAVLDARQASHLLLDFTSPLLRTISAQLQAPQPDTGQVAQALQLLAQAVRFMDAAAAPSERLGTPTQEHPALALLREMWPLLTATTQVLGSNEEVMGQLLVLLGKMMTSLREVLAAQIHIPLLLGIITECFDREQFSSCLDCMACAVEVYGSLGGDAVSHFTGLLSHVCKVAFGHVQRVGGPAKCPQLVKAFFELCHRYLLYCGEALLQCGELGTVLELAVACLEGPNMERDSGRAVLSFLGALVNRCTGPLAKYQGDIEAAVARVADRLLRHLLIGLAGASPSLLWTNLIDCLYACVMAFSATQYVAALRQWLFSALSDEACAALSEEDRHRVLEAMFSLATRSRQLFKAMMLDFAKICHHEMTSDALLSYSM